MPLFKTWNYSDFNSFISPNISSPDENGETNGIDTSKPLQFTDFREKIGPTSFSTNLVTADQENRINYPKLGRTDGILEYNKYISGYVNTKGGIPILLGDPMYKYPIVKGSNYRQFINEEGKTIDNGESYNDFVHFSIHDLSTGNVIPFRSYIESFNDSYNADWSSFKYPGRGDSSYIYESTTRKSSISWKVVALSQIDLLRIYEKLDYLASLMYPKYKETFMEPTILKLSVGNWFRETPVIMDSLTYDIDPETPWDIDITQTQIGAKAAQELPMYVNVSAEFTILHNNIPQKGPRSFLIKYKGAIPLDKQIINANTNSNFPLNQDNLNNENIELKDFE